MLMYLMEDPREAERLRKKSDPESFDQIFFSRQVKKILSNKKKRQLNILDLGCGSGSIVSYLARKYSEINFVGFDINGERFQYEKNRNSFLTNITFHTGNALAMSFESNKFDFVFSRFLFEYLNKPLTVLSEIIRVTKTGGIIMLQDLDGQLISHYPITKSFETKCASVIQLLQKSGFDIYAGRKLFYYARKCALRKITVEIHPYHLFAGKIDSKNYDFWRAKLDIAMPHLIKSFHRKNRANAFRNEYLRYLLNENSLTFSTLFTVVGFK